MAKYYHGGREAVDPARFFPEALEGDDETWVKAEKERITAETRKHHPLSAPHRDNIKMVGNQAKLKRPAAFCPLSRVTGLPEETWDDWSPGSIVLALVGQGYWIVPPGGSVTLDASIPDKVVKANAPHLLLEEEMIKQKQNDKTPAADKPKAKTT